MLLAELPTLPQTSFSHRQDDGNFHKATVIPDRQYSWLALGIDCYMLFQNSLLGAFTCYIYMSQLITSAETL